MKATELRIGNFIECSAITGIIEVDHPENVKCNIQHLDDMLRENEEWIYKPIPLTEEWLSKFGFEKGLDYNQWGISIGRMDFFRTNYGIAIRYNDEHKRIIPVSLQHVHQLQNLILALTGKEL